MNNQNSNIVNNEDDIKTSIKKHKSCNVSEQFANAINKVFFWLGYTVAKSPIKTIVFSIIFTIICSAGTFKFHKEKNPLKLWIPPESKFLRDTEWLMKSFQEGTRPQSVLITADDVLQPTVLLKLLDISQQVSEIIAEYENGTTLGWNEVCFKIPMISSVLGKEREKRSYDNQYENNNIDEWKEKRGRPLPTLDRIPYNPSVDMPSFIFCGIVNSLKNGCLIQNILELWDFDEKVIGQLSKEDILHKLHNTNISATTGHESSFEHLLGGITRNETGYIVSATGLLSHWNVYINFMEVNHDKIGNAAGTEDWASEEALLWEGEFLNTMEILSDNLSDNETTVYYSAGRSYGDISSSTMFQDMNKIIVGGALMFVFMILVLSKFGWVEMRFILCSMGLLSVGMAFGTAIGICSMFGIFYGPVHTSLPFLLMGLGIDDIFVIMASWQKVQSEHKAPNDPSTMPERIGLMLQLAGSSITITSFTDVVAFLIGSITILPSLESFCLYAAIGVLLIYVYTTTFVIAVFALDEYRILARRNSILPWIIHKEETKLWIDAQLMNRAVDYIYSKLIMTTAGKTLVLLITFIVTSYSGIAVFRLEQRFDPNWFIPQGTYLNKFIEIKKDLYPNQGYEAMILMGQLNYTSELVHIHDMVDRMENETEIVHEMSAWIIPFREFVFNYYEIDFYEKNLTDTEFRKYLTKFLYTNSGGKFQANFRFKTKLECGELAPDIMVSTIPFNYRRFNDRDRYIPAMYKIENLVENSELKSGDGFATVWGRIYGNWVTDEVIDVEVQRNIMLALACVMVCTTILIMHPQICFWIFACVILTLINVCGFMQRWGLTIDLVSCIGLELAAGLCVDYSAHVGHTFLVTGPGTKTERALDTIKHIGPAVLYGGGSTLLAVSMLANSEAYTFQAFFKIFLLVITFGLFFGLIFLPVILSVIGPKDFHKSESSTNHSKEIKEICKNDLENSNATEMISFIRPEENHNDKNAKQNECA